MYKITNMQNLTYRKERLDITISDTGLYAS